MAFLGRIVDHQHAVGAGLGRRAGEGLDAHRLDRVGVAHQHDGRLVAGRTEAAHDVEHLAHAHAGGHRPLGGALDGRAVGHRIGERNAELDDVGTAGHQRLHQRQGQLGGGVGGDEGISALRPSPASRLKVCWILDMGINGQRPHRKPAGP
jgi:hypothetical protein